jgi:hypothetical protein
MRATVVDPSRPLNCRRPLAGIVHIGQARLVGSSWDWKAAGWKWERNVPTGPNPVTLAVQKRYLTGNAADPETGEPGPAPCEYAPNQVGLYVKETA